VDPEKIDFYSLGFNFIETKEMFVSDYIDGSWDGGRKEKFGSFEISPGAGVLNYGQGVFEGMKALEAKNGDIVLFRPEENAKRFTESAKRLLMPPYNEKRFLKAVKEVVKANRAYIPPYDSGGALYIRPIMIANGPVLGVAPANQYKLIIFTVPVGPYFPEGFNAIDLEISKEYTRAAPGGTGYAKTCSNYAGTMKPAKETKARGYAQVIYLDASEKKYIEEVGTANFFAVINGKLTTPKLKGTILPGITRKSVLKLGKEKLGMKVEERDISYKELFEKGCTEAFCTGTAAVITPIGSITLDDKKRVFNESQPGDVTVKLYELLTNIQRKEIEDEFDWVVDV